ncbi:hypothetical protein [Candidatus Harpocratesius sp.]
MSAKNKKTKTSTKETKHSSLLISREVYITGKQQLIVSLLMLTVLIIQVYLFVSIFRLIEQLASLQGV